MARWPPVDPRLLEALRVIDAERMPYAELWRLLAPVAARLRLPRPSYWMVRRLAIEERARKRRRKQEIDRLLDNIVAGRSPLA